MTDAVPIHVSDERIAQILGHSGHDRAFLTDAPLRNLDVGGNTYIAVRVRLTSYRALPLSCIERIDISIGGVPQDLNAAVLSLNGVRHPLGGLADLTDVWWFILDTAEILIPGAVADGMHAVTGALVTVEPYITAGRFSFRSESVRTLSVEEACHG